MIGKRAGAYREGSMCEICRRGFMRGAAAIGVAGASGLFSSPLLAQAARGNAGSSRLPSRGEFTIANAYVMTMDSALGDLAGGSVHVRNGEIVAVGRDVIGGGEKIDGAGMIVMPAWSRLTGTCGTRFSAALPVTSHRKAISRRWRALASR